MTYECAISSNRMINDIHYSAYETVINQLVLSIKALIMKILEFSSTKKN